MIRNLKVISLRLAHEFSLLVSLDAGRQFVNFLVAEHFLIAILLSDSVESNLSLLQFTIFGAKYTLLLLARRLVDFVGVSACQHVPCFRVLAVDVT